MAGGMTCDSKLAVNNCINITLQKLMIDTKVDNAIFLLVIFTFAHIRVYIYWYTSIYLDCRIIAWVMRLGHEILLLW